MIRNKSNHHRSKTRHVTRTHKTSRPHTSTLGKWIKRFLTGFFSLILLLVIAVSALFLYAYWTIKIPSPQKVAQAQITTVYYADGKTQMGTFAERNREIINISQLPRYISQSVIASEDRTFWKNNGVDFRGIARAFWNNIQGKPIQGGSTLSQQYVENYYVGKTRSYIGKFKETILALKINRQQSKKEILNNYLNTIYFGRGAYGIQAASQAYFGKPASHMNRSEAALIAGIIPAPSVWDPAVDKKMAIQRWKRVINHMVQDGWLKKDEAQKMTFPHVIAPKKSSSSFTGTKGYILQQVRSELHKRAGYSEADINSLGLKVITTIDPHMQEKMEKAVESLPSSAPKNLRVGMSAVIPQTGAIVAEYGGKDYKKIQSSAVTQDVAQAGSTFKPFTLVAALEQGVSLSTRFSGSATVKVNGKSVSNYAHEAFGNIDLLTATKYSVNTAFIRLNEKIGPQNARLAAIRAGYPKNTLGLNNQILNTLGTSSPHNINITEAFATLANEGVHVKAHIIDKVTDSHGKILYQPDTHGSRVFQKNIVAQVDEALQGVAHGGTGNKAAALGRPVAVKTGSSNDNKSAQFAGYVPQLAAATSLYQVGDKGQEESITAFGGVREVTGGTWPGYIWTKFMKSALSDTKVEKFPQPDADSQEQNAQYKVPDYKTAPPVEKEDMHTQQPQLENGPDNPADSVPSPSNTYKNNEGKKPQPMPDKGSTSTITISPSYQPTNNDGKRKSLQKNGG